MLTYANDIIQTNETDTDFEDLGMVNISRLNGAIPFYSIYDINNGAFNKSDPDRCGGSCLDYLN